MSKEFEEGVKKFYIAFGTIIILWVILFVFMGYKDRQEGNERYGDIVSRIVRIEDLHRDNAIVLIDSEHNKFKYTLMEGEPWPEINKVYMVIYREKFLFEIGYKEVFKMYEIEKDADEIWEGKVTYPVEEKK